jgi:hypothetical protein
VLQKAVGVFGPAMGQRFTDRGELRDQRPFLNPSGLQRTMEDISQQAAPGSPLPRTPSTRGSSLLQKPHSHSYHIQEGREGHSPSSTWLKRQGSQLLFPRSCHTPLIFHSVTPQKLLLLLPHCARALIAQSL